MIAADQPHIHPDLLIGFSSRVDGTMLDRSVGVHAQEVVSNRKNLCDKAGAAYDDAVYLRIMYDEKDQATYDCYAEVDRRARTVHAPEVIADALWTRTSGLGLFLPVADCVATVIFDPKNHYLALLHMGRHSTLTDLLPRMIAKFKSEGSDESDLIVWMSPSAQRTSYKLDNFEFVDDPAWQPYRDVTDDGVYLDMQGYNQQRCLDSGISKDKIHISPIDTMTDDNYFSHARGDTGGRMAIVAMMR